MSSCSGSHGRRVVVSNITATTTCRRDDHNLKTTTNTPRTRRRYDNNTTRCPCGYIQNVPVCLQNARVLSVAALSPMHPVTQSCPLSVRLLRRKLYTSPVGAVCPYRCTAEPWCRTAGAALVLSSPRSLSKQSRHSAVCLRTWQSHAVLPAVPPCRAWRSRPLPLPCRRACSMLSPK